MELNYNSLEDEVFNQLGNSKIMVLATSSEDKVTARNMSFVILDKKIYFQTSKIFLKYQQMFKNHNVALCVDNIQIEGTIKIKNHPFEEPEFTESYKKYHKSSFDLYTHMKDQIVIEVEPTFITLWKYDVRQPFRDFLDCKRLRAYREIYDTSI